MIVIPSLWSPICVFGDVVLLLQCPKSQFLSHCASLLVFQWSLHSPLPNIACSICHLLCYIGIFLSFLTLLCEFPVMTFIWVVPFCFKEYIGVHVIKSTEGISCYRSFHFILCIPIEIVTHLLELRLFIIVIEYRSF